jgi:proteasome lid subunit RPN8/RPN11
MTPELLSKAHIHAMEMSPMESVGVVIDIKGTAEYRRCKNLSTVEDELDLCPDSLVAAQDEGRLIGYIHSHVGGDVRPSATDVKSCNATGVPWWVVTDASQAWSRIDPVGRSIEGRQFVFGVDDCWSIAREWYALANDRELPDFLRSDKFWEHGETPHLDNLLAAGYYEINIKDLREGDGLLMEVAALTINHCAIYVGHGKILHHLPNRLSRIDEYDGHWQGRTRMVVRHD